MQTPRVAKLPFKLIHFSSRTLLKHKVHIGSNLTNLNSTFFRYGFFNWDLSKRTVHIQLKYSLHYLKIALRLLTSVIQAQGTVLIIQEHTMFSRTFLNLLKQTQQPLSFRPWLPGTLSNFKVLRQTYLKVFYLKRELTKHFALLYEKLNITANTKKYVQSKINVNKLSKELVKYVDSLSALPYLVLLGNSLHSHLAVNEARIMGIPSIGLVDSNASVFAVNYFIPWNTKSFTSLALFFNLITLTILKGQLLLRQAFLFKIAHKQQLVTKKSLIASALPTERIFRPESASFSLIAPKIKYLLTAISKNFQAHQTKLTYVKGPYYAFCSIVAFQRFFDATVKLAQRRFQYTRWCVTDVISASYEYQQYNFSVLVSRLRSLKFNEPAPTISRAFPDDLINKLTLCVNKQHSWLFSTAFTQMATTVGVYPGFRMTPIFDLTLTPHSRFSAVSYTPPTILQPLKSSQQPTRCFVFSKL